MIWAYEQAIGWRLLGWSVLSGLAGLGLWAGGGPFWRGFGLQAMAWGLIDGVIAYFGLRGARRRARTPEAEARFLRRVLWINAGLDVVYIAAGAALALTLGAADPEWRGHGWGVVVQGAFLLLFDAAHAWALPGEPRLPAQGFFTGAEHQPFYWEASTADAPAALLVHGFPGTPAEMRAVGETLHAAGWTVRGLLLPGFGADLPTLIDRQYPEWVAAAAAALADLRQRHQTVLVAGYSFGGALAVEAAARHGADGLILLAPFVWAEPLWARALLAVLRPLLPHAFRPYTRANFDDPRFRHGMTKFLPDVDWADPAAQQAVRGFQVPVSLLAELRQTRRALTAAGRVRVPVLIVQGAQDEVSRATVTARLRARLGGPVTYVEVPAGHDLLERTSPGWPAVERALLAFAAERLA